MEKKNERHVKPPEQDAEEAARVIPVIQERPVVGKRMVDTGLTRVRKLVSEREETINVPVRLEEVHVERVPINRFVEAPVEVRQVGDTTVVPVMEEVLVVEKRLRLKEELHIRKIAKTIHEPRTVTLKGEEAVVEHEDTRGRSAGPEPGSSAPAPRPKRD